MKPALLRDIPLFAHYSEAEISRLARDFRRRVFPAGMIIFHEGDPGEHFSIVLKGEIEILKAFGTNEERLLAVLGPGDFVGEMSILDPGGLRSACVRARTDVEWAEITSQAFEELVHRLPDLSLRMMREMSIRLRRSETETIRDLQIKNQALTQAYLALQRAQADLVEKEKLEHELEIARVIQESILPKQLPELPCWRVTARWLPARAVSGDFYDFLPFPDGRLGILIADVTGKGVPAALVMAVTCSILRSVVGSETSPGAILKRVNDLLCPTIPSNMFVTCLFGLFDPASGILRFANAGHNLPIKVGREGVEELRAVGMPLGLLPEMDYVENEAYLKPDTGLLLYTDGIVEAHDTNLEMFGSPRLQACLSEISFGPQVIDHLLARLTEFTGLDWEQEDDITFIILSCPPGG